MIYVTRRERFNAAHKLYRPDWSKAMNEEVYGKCANENWHGHNYDLFVTVKGETDPETGYVLDLKLLSKLINSEIISKLDHKNINLDVPFMSGMIASTENLVFAIWNILAPKITSTFDCELHCIKLYETENNFAEYFGD
jgi:6-pyruvoyltetrahydropterin/6-carboxytetrahydropterin synthase